MLIAYEGKTVKFSILLFNIETSSCRRNNVYSHYSPYNMNTQGFLFRLELSLGERRMTEVNFRVKIVIYSKTF